MNDQAEFQKQVKDLASRVGVILAGEDISVVIRAMCLQIGYSLAAIDSEDSRLTMQSEIPIIIEEVCNQFLQIRKDSYNETLKENNDD